MKTPDTWNYRSLAVKVVFALILAAMTGSVGVAPASAWEDQGRRGRHDDGRYEQRSYGYDNRGRPVHHRRRVYQRDVYRERVYVPPPVIFAPPPPPGIRIFFPPLFFNLN